jgi:hypothetical protein
MAKIDRLFRSETQSQTRFYKTLILVWSVLIVGIFIRFPGILSYVQWSNLEDLPFVIQKLKQINIVEYIKNLCFAFIGITMYAMACVSFGMRIINFLKTTKMLFYQEPLVMLSTQFLLGNGIFSLIFLGMASFYSLSSLGIAIIFLAGLLSGVGEWNVSIRNFTITSSTKSIISSNKLIVMFSCAIFFLSSLLTTARISYDSSAIYFSNAKITSLTKQVDYYTNDNFVVSSFHNSILFSVIIEVFGDQAARMLSWVSGLAIIAFSLALGEIMGLSKSAKPILLALLLTTTAFTDLLGDGKIDLISSSFTLAAIYWMVAQSQNQKSDKNVFILIGMFAGLSAISRPFNVFVLGVFFILFYFFEVFAKKAVGFSRMTEFAHSIVWIGVGAIGFGLYHLLANWMILDSPLAFLSSISKLNPTGGPWDFDINQISMLRLSYPIAATLRNTPQSLGNISPLIIAFLPVALLKASRISITFSRRMISLTIIAILTLILWIFSFFTVVEIRYVLILWFIIYIPISQLICHIINNEDRILRYGSFGLMVLLLTFFVFRTTYISIDSFSPIDKNGNAQCSGFVLCDYLGLINNTAPLNDRVLTLSAYRYYLRTDLFACSTKHEEYKLLQKLTYENPEMFWEEVHRQGYNFIAYENDYTTRHLQFGLIPDPKHTPSWINLEPLSGNFPNAVGAYQISYNNPPNEVEVTCQKNMENILELQVIK